ncbi:MAG: pyridoxal phosphate-dependent aminotransferase family protein [Campylobacterota bacterium]|nr:pyridoxal phosphate-dependent aminotransferase family protein [Campylobacterota bacterium]
MNFYESELKALKRSSRFRERQIYDDTTVDFASNDYLGLAHNKELLEFTCKSLSSCDAHAPKASMLVNGYHQIHKEFETALCRANGFEDAIVVGSGFSANMALIESLLRRGDELFIDEKFHASGVLATRTLEAEVTYFRHNDADDLKIKLDASKSGRKVIAVEGVYSMDGDLLNSEIIDLSDSYEALLIVDEAHSSGVIGKQLLGVFDYYNISIKPNYIKMGTLGKAYGSFGGYILASSHIIEYLLNRAKPIIYATAPSLFDTLLAHKSLEYILKNSTPLSKKIKARQAIVNSILGSNIEALIAPVVFADNKKVMQIKQRLLDEGILVGAIRQPTVASAIIRVIARLGESEDALKYTCKIVNDFRVE